MKLGIIANWMQGSALSGGDRIFIELGRRWAGRSSIKIFISSDGWKICQREKLSNVEYEIWAKDRYNRYGYFVNFIYRTFISIVKALCLKYQGLDIVYSSSDFWPDSIPAFIIKLRNKKIKWVAGFYLFMPSPWNSNFPYKGRKNFIGVFYWILQKPIYYVVKKYADMVFVTSDPDKYRFVCGRLAQDKILIIQGGVDLELANMVDESKVKKYDAIFIGRFHPQKGLLELADIWAKVCTVKKNAMLAVIGEGPLKKEFRDKIRRLGISKNIDLLGFLDGIEKIRVFKSSRIVIHPAIYDSGGMAACEAMSCGLPGISFDLEALKTYYPKGMIKIPCYDLDIFADTILRLLEDREIYEKLQKDALDLAREWDWDKRAEDVLRGIKILFNR